MKPLVMTFVNGPLHRQQVEMKWIPEINIVASERDRIIYAYVREEMIYYYEPHLSAQLTAIYDEIKGAFRVNRVNPIGEIPEKGLDKPA